MLIFVLHVDNNKSSYKFKNGLGKIEMTDLSPFITCDIFVGAISSTFFTCILLKFVLHVDNNQFSDN